LIRSKKTYLIDENVKMSDMDIEKIKSCKIINCTEIFRKGEPDESLTEMARENGWIMVTKDIRMALRSLVDGVPVLFISDDFQSIQYITAKTHKDKSDMFKYLNKRFKYE